MQGVNVYVNESLKIPKVVAWSNGMILEPTHFEASDSRAAALAHISALVADPWPWGFTDVEVDDTALSGGQLRLRCEGVFPDGEPFRNAILAADLPQGEDGRQADFHVVRDTANGQFALHLGDEDVPASSSLPAARLTFRAGSWGRLPDWSPSALLVDAEHPLRKDATGQIGGLAAIAAGFMTTLRLPGAENRPVARTMGQVVIQLSQGIGTIEALLGAPMVSPARLGLESLRMALGVRAAAGVFERIERPWDPADQRGSVRRLLAATETAASGIGLPFRTISFRAREDGIMTVDDVPSGNLLLVIEVSRPADLISARSWFDGAAIGSPDRIRDALTRRVSGCSRQPVERDPTLGVVSSPLLALYQVNDDPSWRAGQRELALAAETPPPLNTSFSILVSETAGDGGAADGSAFGERRPSWVTGGRQSAGS